MFARPVASFGLRFGPAEYFALAFFGLSTVVAFGKDNWLKAFIAVLLGLLLSTVGYDPIHDVPRFSFEILELSDGFSFIPAMIGLFALGEIFHQLDQGKAALQQKVEVFSGKMSAVANVMRNKSTLLRSSLIGTAIGVIPGAGATIASFISYGQAKARSKHPEDYGEGSLEGITASEAANSSSVGGALVPLLALGIPGSATDAVLLGALTLKGLVAGPELFTTHPDIPYGIFVSLIFANLLILALGLLGNTLWLRVIQIPKPLLYVFVIAMCMLGSFTLKNNLFDSWVCFGFGILGWQLKRYKYSPAAVVLGLVLGEMLETNLRQALLMHDWSGFLTRPLSAVLLFLSALSLVLPRIRAFKAKSS